MKMRERPDICDRGVTVRTKIVSSRYLTSDCWSIQFWGMPYCRECSYLATEECGGYRIRKEMLAGEYPKDGLPDLSDRL